MISLNTNDRNNLIGITMGCPVGVGPEIILKFFCEEILPTDFIPVVIGDFGVLERCAKGQGRAVKFCDWKPGDDIENGKIPVLSVSDLGGDLEWGEPDGRTGKAMAAYVTKAVEMILNGVLAAMVTCPISKAALNLAGYSFPGHTEMLASLCGAEDIGMMMAGDRLRVVLVTIHTGLRNVPDLIKSKEVLRIINLTDQSLKRDLGVVNPRIAVAGLNPHAGEEGLFGSEEIEEIQPAIKAAKGSGINVSGPFPPDTVYLKAAEGAFDAVIGMYHDQALIPFKLLHFSDGVNVTLGLPIVRTSVDHGTAYDIAGKGNADAASLVSAYRLACRMVINRRVYKGM